MSETTATEVLLAHYTQRPVSASVIALARAYIELLKMPHGAERLRSQELLALCRDRLAEEARMPVEHVQNGFEQFVATNPKSG